MHPPLSRRFRVTAGLMAAVAVLASCEQVEQVQDRFRDLTPHEAYEASLADAGLSGTALARDWVSAADGSLRSARSASRERCTSVAAGSSACRDSPLVRSSQ